MLKSMIYKEWLKIRWFLIGATAVGLLVVGYAFMDIQRSITFNGANNLWYYILFQNYQFFLILKYVPLLIGIGIGVAQYFPETVSKRIKLTFHLPIRENKALLMMLATGLSGLLISFLLQFITFLIFNNSFFASEMTCSALLTILPWYLAGIAAYFLVALIVLEPIWKFRIFYALSTSAFIPLYLKSGLAGAYAPIVPKLALITILISVTMLFSAYRFRKGEM